ncbi:RsmB/NOP family class I SAM-dependent RNA methyltransferase [Maritimibacter dapengensis]|uniref:RsmB/NOP family class I SAM-dependent RNA methyltransferase n=1 Tax=Maritimibacter dapengensis TaxID=2836868 RepID=A0ABS6T4W8_9RHOB|nr:RsmB/NOP family class I SAM-dependent RNA methyltransferase [Maritimibacter dapengensis]MBV7379397.1 RsmB/NOP family class I SAM-dependent RNA methyltransferase [Maritimibacter dapengensis]
MTPGARAQAAIDVLDAWQAGQAPEQALTRWARASRYAGSKDRAAVRDLVYSAIRCARSHAAMGQGDDGRAMIIGGLREAGDAPEAVFDGSRFAPDALQDHERRVCDLNALPEAVRLDMPDWLLPYLERSLGPDWRTVAAELRKRAPVFLRVNAAKCSRDEAVAALATDGIVTAAHPLSPTALEVVEGARRVHLSAAFNDGLVELQDVASQAVIDLTGVTAGMRVLDYCAGGGGKALAMAAQGAEVYAHDVNQKRMNDLPERVRRAGVDIAILECPGMGGTYDMVLADAPCSGSGAWRRAPQGKWDLTEERLSELCNIQAEILGDIAPLVAVGGQLVYATCSLFDEENQAQIEAFISRTPGWKIVRSQRFTPLDGGDGFFVAVLQRDGVA